METIRTITREQLSQMNARVFEVLSEHHWASGHIPGAKAMPLDRIAQVALTEAPDQDADIVQYRAGVGFEFPFSKAELGIGSNIGVYRFATSGDSDSSPYVEFEGSLGFRPIPPLKIGGLLMATYTQSSFTRSHTHLFGNYSGGLGVEWSF